MKMKIATTKAGEDCRGLHGCQAAARFYRTSAVFENRLRREAPRCKQNAAELRGDFNHLKTQGACPIALVARR
jgi:hypothetical protein